MLINVIILLITLNNANLAFDPPGSVWSRVAVLILRLVPPGSVWSRVPALARLPGQFPL